MYIHSFIYIYVYIYIYSCYVALHVSSVVPSYLCSTLSLLELSTR